MIRLSLCLDTWHRSSLVHFLRALPFQPRHSYHIVLSILFLSIILIKLFLSIIPTPTALRLLPLGQSCTKCSIKLTSTEIPKLFTLVHLISSCSLVDRVSLPKYSYSTRPGSRPQSESCGLNDGHTDRIRPYLHARPPKLLSLRSLTIITNLFLLPPHEAKSSKVS